MKLAHCRFLFVAFLLLAVMQAVKAQPFSYVGTLSDAGGPVPDGNYDFQIRLFDDETNGGELASPNLLPAVTVSGGSFAMQLDFGTAVAAAPDAWLQLEVRPSGGVSYDVQQPRQRITGVPLALFSEFADSSDWNGLANLPSGFADGVDDDSLASLSCGDGALPTFNASGGAWECGAPGADGRSVLSGPGAPAGGLGSDGDFYIDTTAWAIYGPKAGGAWGVVTNLQGPQGVQGVQGPQGPQGLSAGEQPYTGDWGLLVFSGSSSTGLNGAPPATGFRVHRFEFPVDRPVDVSIGSGMTPATVQIGELTVWLETNAAFPALAAAPFLQNPIGQAVLIEGSNPAGAALLTLTNIRVLDVSHDADNVPGQVDLARVRMDFHQATINYGGDAVSYNQATMGSTPPAANCNNVLSTLNAGNGGAIHPAANSLPLLSATNLWAISHDNSGAKPGQMDSPVPQLGSPKFRQHFPSGQAIADVSLPCVLAKMLTASAIPAVEFTQFGVPDPDTAYYSLTWGTAYPSSFLLRNDPAGGLEFEWALHARTQYISQPPGADFCWDFALNTVCGGGGGP